MQLGFMELNGKARDRRGNEICSKVRRVAETHPRTRERERRKREREREVY